LEAHVSTTDSIPKVRVGVPRHLEDQTKKIRLRLGVVPYRGRRRPSWWRRALDAVKRSGRAS
jgi:hypothetical protein